MWNLNCSRLGNGWRTRPLKGSHDPTHDTHTLYAHNQQRARKNTLDKVECKKAIERTKRERKRKQEKEESTKKEGLTAYLHHHALALLLHPNRGHLARMPSKALIGGAVVTQSLKIPRHRRLTTFKSSPNPLHVVVISHWHNSSTSTAIVSHVHDPSHVHTASNPGQASILLKPCPNLALLRLHSNFSSCPSSLRLRKNYWKGISIRIAD